MSVELLGTARRLAKASPKKPRQCDLKRSISTAYYALFHAIAKSNADLAMGVGADRPTKAWAQTYRALDHNKAKKACISLRGLGFPVELIDCGEAFVSLQQARHDADYDPLFRTSRQEALACVDTAEDAMDKLKAASRRDRLAFCAVLLHDKRR